MFFAFIAGTKYSESEPVYPSENIEAEGVFPDGKPFNNDKNPSYVFVWKTWGRRGNPLITFRNHPSLHVTE